MNDTVTPTNGTNKTTTTISPYFIIHNITVGLGASISNSTPYNSADISIANGAVALSVCIKLPIRMYRDIVCVTVEHDH